MGNAIFASFKIKDLSLVAKGRQIVPILLVSAEENGSGAGVRLRKGRP